MASDATGLGEAAAAALEADYRRTLAATRTPEPPPPELADDDAAAEGYAPLATLSDSEEGEGDGAGGDGTGHTNGVDGDADSADDATPEQLTREDDAPEWVADFAAAAGELERTAPLGDAKANEIKELMAQVTLPAPGASGGAAERAMRRLERRHERARRGGGA